MWSSGEWERRTEPTSGKPCVAHHDRYRRRARIGRTRPCGGHRGRATRRVVSCGNGTPLRTRPGCSERASVAYGMRAEDLVFVDRRAVPRVTTAASVVLCLRHADSMVVPRVDARRSPRSRPAPVPSAPSIAASPVAPGASRSSHQRRRDRGTAASGRRRASARGWPNSTTLQKLAIPVVVEETVVPADDDQGVGDEQHRCRRPGPGPVDAGASTKPTISAGCCRLGARCCRGRSGPLTGTTNETPTMRRGE